MLARRELNLSPLALSLADDLRRGRPVGRVQVGVMTVEAIAGRDHLWLRVRGPAQAFALRACSFMAGRAKVRRARRRRGEALRFAVESLVGRQDVSLRCHDRGAPVLELECIFTPAQPLSIPFMARDLYLLDDDGMPGGEGCVEASQRGMNSGLCFVRLQQPGPSTLLYWQDLTALNAYFAATGTKPDGVVGGEWPELGFRLPTAASPQVEYPKPLPAGRPTTISRALVAMHEGEVRDESDLATHFLTLSAAIYPLLARPRCELRDWRGRAERTGRDLGKAHGATVQHYGHTYVRPYNEAEYPDSMTQTTLVAAMREWERLRDTRLPLTDKLEAGLSRFYDAELGALRRYLPNVGDDKNQDEVDSWYLYYPLLGLARMALQDDERARELYLRSVDFGIKAAQHFRYCFPIKFNINDFNVITAARGDGQHGQTDVAGLYAYVMMLGFDLTGEDRFLDEARAAMEAARGLRFNLNYQANLTAWGAAAAMRLWRTTAKHRWLKLSYIYLASFLHNTAAWESDIGHARSYPNFLGATALHDAPYMALLECSESFLAFRSYIHDCGPDLLPGARLLIDEYCRYAIDRAWFYFPDALPPEAIAGNPRDGSIDRELSFPVEDLYIGGQPAGQVGQEIYGAGAAFIFASGSFHRLEGAPFEVFCDAFVFAWDRPTARSALLTLAGSPEAEAMLALTPLDGRRRRPVLKFADGRRCKGRLQDGALFFRVPADASLRLTW
ncbi:MAG TPA: hypothetical protein VIC34_01280 [Croceibacterium sp.]|jgi:hypothetical protein